MAAAKERAQGPKKEGPTMKNNIRTQKPQARSKQRVASPSPAQKVARCSAPSRVRSAGAGAPPLTAPVRRALPKAGEGQTVSPTEALGSGCQQPKSIAKLKSPAMTIGLDLGDRLSCFFVVASDG